MTQCTFIDVANNTDFSTLTQAQLLSVRRSALALTTYETLADREEELLKIGMRAKKLIK